MQRKTQFCLIESFFKTAPAMNMKLWPHMRAWACTKDSWGKREEIIESLKERKQAGKIKAFHLYYPSWCQIGPMPKHNLFQISHCTPNFSFDQHWENPPLSRKQERLNSNSCVAFDHQIVIIIIKWVFGCRNVFYQSSLYLRIWRWALVEIQTLSGY